MIRFWLHFCFVLAPFLHHFRLVWRVRLHAQKLHPYGTKTSFLPFQPVSNSLENAYYVEDRLGAPAGFKKMPIWAPFWHPNGSQNGLLKAFETATAPRDPLRASKSLKSLNIKSARSEPKTTWVPPLPEPLPYNLFKLAALAIITVPLLGHFVSFALPVIRRPLSDKGPV